MKEFNKDNILPTLIWLGFWFLLFIVGYIKHRINKKNTK